MLNLGDIAYWDRRYEDEQTKNIGFKNFDWYCPFSRIFPTISSMVDMSGTHKILIIGVGKSNIIDCLYKNGFRDITAIDISSKVIQEMQREYASFTGIEFYVMDVKELIKFSNETFTLVFDKACVDCLFCGTDFMSSTKKAFSEIYRVMRKESTFIVISHGSPISRVPLFRAVNWAVECYLIDQEIGESLTIYTLMKTANELLLKKKIVGGDMAKREMVVGLMDKVGSGKKKGKVAGSLTVTSNTDDLDELLAESAERDG